MARINYKQLFEAYRALPVQQANQHLTEAIKSRYIDTGSLDLGAMFVEAYGSHAYFDCRNNQALATRYMEADAVTTAAFSNITGQIVYSRVMDAFAAETMIASSLVETISTRFQGEKIPGVSEIGDQAQIVNEAENYPLAGVSEDYIETPSTVKRGMIVPVSREAVFFDRTNLVLRRAADVGRWLGQNKEKRIWDVIIDENTTTGRYKWRGTTYATYQSSTPWVNLNATNGLSDYTNIDDSLIMFSQMTDPNTGEPITIVPNTILVTPSKLAAARRIVNATQVQHGTGAANVLDQNDPFEVFTSFGNPVGQFRVVSSQLMAARLATDTSWFLGDFRRAFAYMENWPVTVTQAPVNSHDEFTRDIVAQFKASEMGAAATLEPRAVVKSTVA